MGSNWRLVLACLLAGVAILVVYMMPVEIVTFTEPDIDLARIPQTEQERALELELSAEQPMRELVLVDRIELNAAEPGAISGLVVDLLGQPIEGAACHILSDLAPIGLGGMVSRENVPRVHLASVMTDRQGAFRVEVPEGFWELRVEAKGRATWIEHHVARGEYRIVRLQPARELVVRVLDDAMLPIVGARVSVMRAEFHDPLSADTFTLTDWRGEARFESLSFSGAWYVHAQHEQYVTVVEELSKASGAPARMELELTRGVRIEGSVVIAGGLAPAGPVRIQFDSDQGNGASHFVFAEPDGSYLSKRSFPLNSSVEVAALAPGFGELRKQVGLITAPESGRVKVDFELSSRECYAIGGVTGLDGVPVKGVEILVKPIDALPDEVTIRIPSQEVMDRSGTPNLSANDPVERAIARLRLAGVTNSNGEFVLGGLHANVAYKIMLVSETYGNRVLWFPEHGPGETLDFGAVRLALGGRISGHVRRADGLALEGQLVHTVNLITHQLIPNTDFTAQRSRSELAPFDAFTNADGFFSLQPLPPGKFLLICLGKIFGPYTLEEGASLGPLELETKDPYALDGGATRPVQLSVWDETGTPIVGSFVTFIPVGPRSVNADALGLNDTYYTSTDGAGQAQRDITPGLYRATAMDMTGRHARKSLEVAIEPGDKPQLIDFYLPAAQSPPAALQGLVTDAFGLPLPEMLVSLIPNTGEISCQCMELKRVTDEHGKFSFGPFVDGGHQLIVTDPKLNHSTAYFYPAVPGKPALISMGQ